MITWTTMTDGLLGGALGAGGAFTAALLTIRHGARADRKREDARAAELDEQRRREVIARLLGTMRAVETEVRLAPFLSGRTDSEFLQFVVLFYLDNHGRHPAVARWVLDRHTAYSALLRRWRKVWWVPIVRNRRLHDMGVHLGETIAAINRWAVGDVGDDWFDHEPTAAVATV